MSFLRRSRVEAKSPSQIVAMRAAGLLVAQTLDLVIANLRAGVSTGELDAMAEEHIRAGGATPSFKGYYGFPGSLCISVNEEVVHGIPGPRILADGDLVSIDCGAIVEGWHGDSARTAVVGGREMGNPADLALMDDTEAAMWAGISALRAGGHVHDVGARIESSVSRSLTHRIDAGADLTYGLVEDFVGHGIGREMHMEPPVPNYAVQGKGPSVPVGATLAIEPMVTAGSIQTRTLADDWTVVTSDGSRAAHWEHTVAVTEGGLWVLTAIDGGQQQLPVHGVSFAPTSA